MFKSSTLSLINSIYFPQQRNIYQFEIHVGKTVEPIFQKRNDAQLFQNYHQSLEVTNNFSKRMIFF